MRHVTAVGFSLAGLGLAGIGQLEGAQKNPEKQAIAARRAGQLDEAERAARECLDRKPKNATCLVIARDVTALRLKALREQADSLDPADLPARYRVAQAALRLDSTPAWAREMEASAESTMRRVRERARVHVEEASRPDAPPGALAEWPASLREYLHFMPELTELQDSAIQRLLDSAGEPKSVEEYAQALAATMPCAGHPLAVKVTEWRTAVVDLVESSVRQATETRRREHIGEAARRLEILAAWLPEDDAAEAQRLLTAAGTAAIRAALPKRPPGSGPAWARVVQELVLGTLRTATLGDVPWKQLVGAAPQMPVKVMMVATLDPACTSAVDTRQLTARVATAWPPSFSRGDDAGTAIQFEIFEVACRVGTEESGEEPIPSTYTVSYQQHDNPRYLQLREALQRAEALLRSIDQDVYHLATHLAASKLVGRINADLRETPRFIEVPIEQAYEARSVRLLRTGSLRVGLRVRDAESRFSDTTWVQASSSAEGKAVRGVQRSDPSGLVATEPSLPADANILSRTANEIGDHLSEAARSLGERVMLDRARSAQRRKATGEALGYLLFAHDWAPKQGVAPPLGPNLTSGRLTLAGVGALVLPPLTSPGRLEQPSRRAASPPESARLAAIQKALDSVVTIETASGRGSGFVVSRQGLILTNAHVVGNAAKLTVHTRSGDSHLGTVVRSLLDIDLALVRVGGLDVPPLPLAPGVPPAVGVDVVAVGSPLGLEGTVTRGIVSAIRRRTGVTLLQIDAAINPGNSGGPLLTEDGLVVGVNTMKLAPGKAEAMGFAIWVGEAKKVFAEFLP
jgi:hypothetical protein